MHHLAVDHRETFYFFFNCTDDYTSTAICAGKCLLYQLYIHNRKFGKHTNAELQNAIEESGGNNAKSIEAVWDVVLKYSNRLKNSVFILDGLDETTDVETFLDRLLQLLENGSARISLTSRTCSASAAAAASATFLELGSYQATSKHT